MNQTEKSKPPFRNRRCPWAKPGALGPRKSWAGPILSGPVLEGGPAAKLDIPRGPWIGEKKPLISSRGKLHRGTWMRRSGTPLRKDKGGSLKSKGLRSPPPQRAGGYKKPGMWTNPEIREWACSANVRPWRILWPAVRSRPKTTAGYGSVVIVPRERGKTFNWPVSEHAARPG